MTTGWRRRCPNGHVDVRARSPGVYQKSDPDAPNYVCETCGDEFDHLRPAPTSDQPAWKGEVLLK